MKRAIFVAKTLALAAVAALTLSSCFNTRLLVGDVTKNEPLIEVNKVWNHGVLWGLVPLDNATMKTAEFTDNAPNYVVKTNMSFLNMLVYGLTAGIYSPTQTKYYLPASEAARMGLVGKPASDRENKKSTDD